MIRFQVNEIITDFDTYLEEQSLNFEAIVIGGAALALLGIITRTTRDVDLLISSIPPIIQRHAKEFAKIHGLAETWLNNAPESLKNELPAGWESRIQRIYQGRSLTLWTLERQHLIISKLYAACDRDADDFHDLLAMKPNEKELYDATDWVVHLDGNPSWPNHVLTVAQRLKRSLI